MARDDDERSGSGGKTAASVRSNGHAASGGHHISQGRNMKAWDIYRDDDSDDGGDVYTYQEYPKHVVVDGKTVSVNNAEEEATALAGDKIVRDAEERTRMMKIAEINNLQVDGRWGLAKIAQAITDAGFDPDANPFA